MTHGPTETTSAPLDLEFFRDHFDPWDTRYPEQMYEAVPHLHAQCPVTRSDRHGGFWLATIYDDVVKTFQNWRDFSSTVEKSIHRRQTYAPVRVPISADPPVQTAYRHLLNPYLTPARVAKFEPGVRQLATELIDSFIERGECDLVSDFAREFPGRMLYTFLFNIDPDEVPMVQEWSRQASQRPLDPKTDETERKWAAWTYQLVERRRTGPRQDDILDALLYGQIDGRLLTDDEVVGAIMLLISGGFGTTADLIANAMYRLAENPELQARLRAEPELIPRATEEFLRYDSPVSMIARYCLRDTTVGGVTIPAGDRVALSIIGANRDAHEFPEPVVLDIDREPNRHIAFGVGTHRCIGSNVARLNFRVSLEELLKRLGPFRLADGFEHVERDPTLAWGPTCLPLVFEPAKKTKP